MSKKPSSVADDGVTILYSARRRLGNLLHFSHGLPSYRKDHAMRTAVGRVAVLWCLLGGITTSSLFSEDSAPQAKKSDAKLVPLNKQETVLLDAEGKRLILKSEVAMREGLLEMLVCLKQSKEHESVLSVATKAQTIHAGLLALGAEPGEGVKFTPEFQPPTGQQLNIFLTWRDEDDKLHRVPAQSWVRNATRRYFVEKLARLPNEAKLPADKNLKYDEKRGELLWYGSMTKEERDQFLALSKDQAFRKVVRTLFDQSQMREMKADFVFAGSSFYTDEKTGEQYYQAEAGDLICVANFASSVIDVDAESSATNDGLMFEAYTERIPKIGTAVQIEILPVFKKDGKPVEERPKSPVK